MLEREEIKKLFIILQARYGHKWTTAYDNPAVMRIAIDEWYRELRGYSPEDLRTGVDLWDEPWPPSLPEFSSMCLPGLEELGIDVEKEVRERLPSYKFMAKDAYEENQRSQKEQEIREQVVVEYTAYAKKMVKELGVAELQQDAKRLLS